MKVSLERKDWKAGYEAGKAGKPGHASKGVDGLSWLSGYIEGKSKREKQKGR
jgi:hypothetical protein